MQNPMFFATKETGMFFELTKKLSNWGFWVSLGLTKKLLIRDFSENLFEWETVKKIGGPPPFEATHIKSKENQFVPKTRETSGKTAKYLKFSRKIVIFAKN